MTREEIIKLAEQVKNTFGSRMCDENGETHGEELYCLSLADIEDAVEFVAEAERESCAKVCALFIQSSNDRVSLTALDIYDAILARSNHD